MQACKEGCRSHGRAWASERSHQVVQAVNGAAVKAWPGVAQQEPLFSEGQQQPVRPQRIAGRGRERGSSGRSHQGLAVGRCPDGRAESQRRPAPNPVDPPGREIDRVGMPRRTVPATPPSPNVLDLFSGIGGLSLGLHWAGMRTTAFCESDPFARSVLRRHWPGVPVYDDIRTLTAARLRDDGVPPPWLVCGGFPCQDVSLAGRGAGIEGARTGLWSHMARLVAECRPRWVVAENVPGLRGRGADRVLHDLESAGYAYWPLVVGAVHAGAPHRRARVWLVAQSPAADAGGAGLEMGERCAAGPAPGLPVERRGGWPAESVLRRVDDGISAGLDRSGHGRVARLRALGNAAVPQSAAMLGRAVTAASPEWTATALNKGRCDGM